MTLQLNIKDWSIDQALSRLSSLYGIYIGPHQFNTQDLNAPFDNIDSLKEVWVSNHPVGDIKQISSQEELERHERPSGLLISKSDAKIYILRGPNGDQSYIIEGSDHQQTDVNTEQLFQTYNIYHCAIEPSESEFLTHTKPVTASEWFKYLIKAKKSAIRDAIFGTITMNLLALGTAMYSMQVYDRVVPSQSNSTLIVLTLGVLIAIAFEFVIKQQRSKLIDQTFKDVDIQLSSIFFNKALGIRLDARPKNVGTFISELRQFETVRGFMTSSTLFVLADAPFAIFFAIFMMFVGGILGVIPLGFVVIMLIVGFYMSSKLQDTNKKLIEENNRKNGFLIESMDGIESIKAAAAESQLLHTWQKINGAQSVRELFHRDVSNTTTFAASTIQQFAYILTVATGAMMIHNNQLTMGGLIGCTILSGRILAPLSQIPQLLVQWSQIKNSLASLNNIMSLPSDTDNHDKAILPESIANEIRLENIKFGYESKQVTLDISQLKVSNGEFIAILGKVGSGKSTLLKLLANLYSPQEGTIRLGNIDSAQLPAGLVRKKIGYLPQDTRLIRGTLRDNITLGLPYASDSAVLSAAQKVGLDRIIQSHPLGINLPISEGGMGLSGGQKQMVVLARLFLAEPDFLLLDEPTASLDGELENLVIRNLVAFMNQNKTIVAVTHKPSLVKFATRVMIVENGKIVEDGPKTIVLNKLKEKFSRPEQEAT
jgi:ATP-binding cassette, subfamily C, bacterial LapB